MSDVKDTVFNIKVNYGDALKVIAELRGNIAELTTAEQGLQKQYKAGKITAGDYQSQMAELKTAQAAYKSELKDCEKFVRNQVKAQSEEEGSLRQLRAELSNCTAAYDNMSREERNGAAGKAMQQHINEITKELKDAEEATGRFYRNVGNYENSIKSALGINSKFASSILALGGNAKTASQWIENAKGSVQAFGTAAKALLTNPIVLAIAGVAGAGAAFKWWVDYNNGLAEATKLTQEFTGKEGDELKEYRNQVQAVADTFGKDFKDVLNSADKLSAQFGIDASDALQMIQDGFVAGADAQGTFLNSLEQYPAAFKEAGLSADQFTAIVAQTKSGIFDESGLNAIKQANARIRQMSSTTAASLDAIGIDSQKVTEELKNGTTSTFEVLQTVAAKLKELPASSQEVGNALVNVFGKQGRDAGLSMIETLSSMSTNLEEVKNETGDLGKYQEEQLKANEDLTNAMTSLFDMTGGAWESMKTAALVYVKEGLASVIKWVQSAVDGVKNLYDQSVLFRVLVTAIGQSFTMTWKWIVNILTTTANTVKNLGILVKGIFTLDWSTIKRAFTNQLDNIAGFFKNFSANIVSIWKNMFKAMASQTKKAEKTLTPGKKAAGTQASSTTFDTADTGEEDAGTSVATVDNTKEIEDAKKKEQELIRQAEDNLLSLIRDKREQQRQQIETSYNRQIEDLKNELATEKNLTQSGREAINTSIEALEEKKNRELDALGEQALQDELAQRQALIERQLASVKEGSDKEYALKRQLLETKRQEELSDETLTQEMRQAIIDDYNNQFLELAKEQQLQEQQQALDAITARYEAEFEALGENEYAKTQLMVQLAEERRDALSRVEGESDEEFAQRQIAAQEDVTKATEKASKQQQKIEKAKVQAISSTIGGLVDVTEQLGETNEAFAKLSKVLALGEIAVNTGEAIAEGVKQAMAIGFPQNIAAVATTVATVLANIATAISTVKGASFAEGGLITGEGTGTSDSITARVSNGESVMTAAATSMFAPLLSTLNQAGGGVPINVTETSGSAAGKDMLAEAVTEGVKNLQIYTAIDEVNRGIKNMQYVESRSRW